MADFMEVCQRAALAGGRVLLDFRGRIHPQEKGPKDLVTEADFASQEAIRQIVSEAYPDHGFLGEENAPARSSSDAASAPGAEYCWVVDPLDGTLNYVHQLPNYSVSVALRRGNEMLVGTVFDPILEECFTAQSGGGARLNGTPLQPSACERVDQALVAASLPAVIPRDSPEVARFIEVMHSSQAIRRLGSAALNLCYVAAGRLDAYWATCVKIWDVGAGQLIVREAGGTLTRPDGTPFDLDRPQFLASATPRLHEQLLQVLQRTGG